MYLLSELIRSNQTDLSNSVQIIPTFSIKVLIAISGLSVQPDIKARKLISGSTVTRFIRDLTGRNCVYILLSSAKTLIDSLANIVRNG